MNTRFRNICFLDFETTGIDVYNDEPIEIGAVVVDSDCIIINEFHSRIKLNAKKTISNDAFIIHGIDANELVNEPATYDVLNSFFEKLGNDFCFASWNISFDVGFFKKMCHENGMLDKYNLINYRHIDVQTLAQVADRLGIFSRSVKSFSDCVDYFNLHRMHLHNAYEDAKLCSLVYCNLIGMIQK